MTKLDRNNGAGTTRVTKLSSLTAKFRFLGACSALLGLAGCAAPSGEPAIEGTALPLQEARAVLGFEHADAWMTETGALRESSIHDQGDAALRLEMSDHASLISAPFEFRKTPNRFTFDVRGGDAASSQLELAAYFSCENRGQDTIRELVGNVSLHGLTTAAFTRGEVVVPEALKTRLAGGCDQLTLQLDLSSGEDSGTYVFDAIGLRAATPAVESLSDPLCGMPANAQLAKVAEEMPEGFMDYQAWMADPRVQAELIELEAALQPFSAEALESTLDHERQQIVVPVDATALASGSVQRALEAAELSLPLRVQTACHPVQELRAVEAAVAERNWHSLAKEIAFGVRTDAEHGQVLVTLDRAFAADADTGNAGDAARGNALAAGAEEAVAIESEPSAAARDIASTLEARFGALVRIEWGAPRRNSRAADAQPHFGAAAISDGVSGCTSGFIIFSQGVHASVTAGHCYGNGITVKSGANTYGKTAGKVGFPTFDMERIDANGQTFARSIWTDPGAPTSRIQTHKINAPTNSLVCTSGKKVFAICNITVVSQTAKLCDKNGCTPNLAEGTKANVTLSMAGDSGAVMYSPDGASGATIVGMAIGSNQAVGEVVWHRESDIESHLGVTVALN